MGQKQPITAKDLKGTMVTHIDYDDHFLSVYRDDDHSITVLINAERKSNKNPEPKITRVYALDGVDGQFYTAQEVAAAYNKKHGL